MEPRGAGAERQLRGGHRGHQPERSAQQQQQFQSAEPVGQPADPPGPGPEIDTGQRVPAGVGRQPVPDRVPGRADRARQPAETHVPGPVVQPAGPVRRAALQHAQDPERPGLFRRSPGQRRPGRAQESRGAGHQPERPAVPGQRRVLGHAQEPGRVPVRHPETRPRQHGRAPVRVPERQPDSEAGGPAVRQQHEAAHPGHVQKQHRSRKSVKNLIIF